MLHPRNGFYEITRQFLLPDVPLQFEQLEGLHAARKSTPSLPTTSRSAPFGGPRSAESRSRSAG